MRWPVGSIALLFVALPQLGSAQSSLAGAWLTEFDTAIRVVNGVESSEGKRRAQIDFQVSGDSIHGTWQNLDGAGAPQGGPRPMHGVLTAAEAHVEMVRPTQLVIRDPDGEREVQAIMTYSLAVRGDSLLGTVQWVALDHSSRGPIRPFAATRKKA
jgi:hypothetical protein